MLDTERNYEQCVENYVVVYSLHVTLHTVAYDCH